MWNVRRDEQHDKVDHRQRPGPGGKTAKAVGGGAGVGMAVDRCVIEVGSSERKHAVPHAATIVYRCTTSGTGKTAR